MRTETPWSSVRRRYDRPMGAAGWIAIGVVVLVVLWAIWAFNRLVRYRNRSDEGWWEDAYPLKFHEYLAAGKPVVSTRVASIAHFAGVAEFVVGVDAWIDGLTRAIARGGVGTATERRAVARANDWDARVDTLESWLKGLIAMPERRVFAQEEACSSLQ